MSTGGADSGRRLPAFLRIDRELLIIDGLLLLFAVFMFWVSTDLSQVARRAPLWILGTMIVLILVDLVIMGQHVARGEAFLDQSRDDVEAPMRQQLTYLGALAACGLLIYFLGYRIATPIFLTGFLLAMRTRLKLLIPYVVISSAVVYFVFSELLRVR